MYHGDVLELAGCVLDPFAGSGTTVLAVQSMRLVFISIDANEQNYNTARERCW
jgi:DNA modification methylase